MENALFERWGKYGLGGDHDESKPVIGAIHLAAGFFVSAMMGCEVIFQEAGSPMIRLDSRPINSFMPENAFKSQIFRDFTEMCETLQSRFGYLCGDIDWNGVLNNTLDLFGADLFLLVQDDPPKLHALFDKVALVCERFFSHIRSLTGTTSTAVNRSVSHFSKSVLLHSECTHTMIAVPTYEDFLLRYDRTWAKRYPPYGIHYCGSDLERFIEPLKKVSNLSFLDVGWGSDVRAIRTAFPDTFLNIRLSPVELASYTQDELRQIVRNLVIDAGSPWLTGVCCINVDDGVSDDKITTILETVTELRAGVADRRTE